ncbi:hypothetical protein POJ06DRAFT_241087 [Lipomyces tetrasporus]|uniref:Uncharacterized protein n=1 Tax=Lipomyces tetrasporus TaxID=54092 RepID=A0AAD7VNZ4_9ASCO|nr:uncharacterized protein POJ06DRAFT_241087 [Lipomyces tetrasporus]KAJ8097072.1 hypothetical protein POJ06DRAFT_241087 [Lipomyces tetrasporus]
MHTADSPSLAASAAPKAPQFLRLSAPLESEKRNFLVLTADVVPAPAISEDQAAAAAAAAVAEAEARPRSESIVSTASDVSSTNGIRRWVSNIDIPEEATF